jgi:hypothetical protein
MKRLFAVWMRPLSGSCRVLVQDEFDNTIILSAGQKPDAVAWCNFEKL